MRRAGQKRKFSVEPAVNDGGGLAGRGDQGGHEEVGIDHANQGPGASGLVARLSNAAFRADLADGFVDDALNFIRIGVGKARPHVLNCALKHAPPDGILDEFREIALFHALGAQSVRRVRSVSFETLMLQRTACSMFIRLYAQADRRSGVCMPIVGHHDAVSRRNGFQGGLDGKLV